MSKRLIVDSYSADPDDLESLRALSIRTGKSKAYHIREAVHRYLVESLFTPHASGVTPKVQDEPARS